MGAVGATVDQRPGSGWAAFAGVFLILAGVLHALVTYAAIVHGEEFVG